MIALPSQHSPSPFASDLKHKSPVISTIRKSKVLTQADIQKASEVPDRYSGWDVDIEIDAKRLLRLPSLWFIGSLRVVNPGLVRDGIISLSI